MLYFDHASSTPLEPAVKKVMLPYLSYVGNPSSLHPYGQKLRVAIDRARREIKDLLHIKEGDLFFTSGATEANNWVIHGLVDSERVKEVISSPLEHPSVLHPLQQLASRGRIKLLLLEVDSQGGYRLDQLENLLVARNNRCLVSLMHGQNELGNLYPIDQIGRLCQKYGALFHSDMVQTIGLFQPSFADLPIDFCSVSAHKFYGPRGVGFLYAKQPTLLSPILRGGAQERGMRAGTEGVALIVGLAQALANRFHEGGKKREAMHKMIDYLWCELSMKIEGLDLLGFNEKKKRLPTILAVALSPTIPAETLLVQLAMEGVAASSGSACTSGSGKRSHVLDALGLAKERSVVRLSIGHGTTSQEVDLLVKIFQKLLL